MNRGPLTLHLRGLGLVGTCAALLLTAPALAQSADAQAAPEARAEPSPATPPTPPSPTVEECVEAHESAQVLRLDGHLIQSRSALGACAQEACPDPLKHECVTWREEVSNQIPTVIFEALTNEGAAGQATVSVDDHELTRTLDGRSLELDPGRYQFRFELPNGSQKVVSKMVKPGDRNLVVSADFRTTEPVAAPAPQPMPVQALPPVPLPEAAKEPPPRVVPTATYVLGGVAVASAGLAIGLGLTTNTKEQNSSEQCAPHCSQARVDEITRFALLTDISMGVALGSAISATLIYAFSDREEPGATALGPSLLYSPDGTAYGSLRGSF